MIDTHCHFDFPHFCEEPETWISRAQVAGLKAMIVPSVSSKNWSHVISLSARFPCIYFALGLHPLWIASHQDADIEKLDFALLHTSKQCVAIGECGLDFAMDPPQIEKQIFFVQKQLVLAQKYGLPVILHCRKAHNELLQILNQFPNVKGVLHGFTGSEQLGLEYIRRGFLLGIGGSITYPRAHKTRKAVASLPLSSLVLETDAPDMPIFGFQGEANLPERLPHIAQCLSELKNIPLDDVIQLTTENAIACFKLKHSKEMGNNIHL